MAGGGAGTAVRPRIVTIIMFEDRHGNHVINVESSQGDCFMRHVEPREERTLLSESCAILRRLMKELGE